jgi:coproporphyrinogen III oxidase-like Fe-S oxidoreductase
VPSATEPSLSLYEQRAPESLWREALWLALRELDGVRWSQFVALHHVDPRQACAAILERLTERGLVISSPDSLRLSDQGVLFADDVGAAFL